MVEAAEHDRAGGAERRDRDPAGLDQPIVRVVVEPHRVASALVEVEQAVIERVAGERRGLACDNSEVGCDGGTFPLAAKSAIFDILGYV
jgi:hypothetical protein